MEGVSLEDVLHEMASSGQLFRDGEPDTPTSSKKGGLFTWRPRKEDPPSLGLPPSAPPSSVTAATATAATAKKSGGLFALGRKKSSKSTVASVTGASSEGGSGGETGLGAGQLSVVERLVHHKHAVRAVVAVPAEPQGEVWSLDEGGLVVRWPQQAPEKAGAARVHKGHFSTSAHSGHAMVVCGRHVWISTGDVTEIRDFSARLMWKLPRTSTRFVEHGSLDAAWCAGNEGVIGLYKQEKLEVTVQLTARSLVTALAQVANPVAGESELWVAQGRVLSVVAEATGKVVADLPPSLVDGQVNEMVAARGSVWMACEDGKVVRFSIAERTVQQSIQTMEGPCWGVLVSASRLWACGTGRNIRLFDVETGAPLETIVNAHEEGGITAMELVEVGGKLMLWSGGRDKNVIVWNASVDSLKKKGSITTLVPVLGREESDEFEDSASDVSSDRNNKASDMMRSPRTGAPAPGVSPRMHRHVASLGGNSPIASAEDELDEESGGGNDRGSGGGGTSGLHASSSSGGLKKKLKKRVVSKLFLAAQAGSVEKMKSAMESVDSKAESEEDRLAARRKVLDARGPGRRTPLHAAAASGKVECVQLLLDWGANVAIKDKTDLYALNCATATDVKALLTQYHLAAGLDTGPAASSSSSSGGKGTARGHHRTKSVAVGGSERSSGRARVTKKKTGMITGVPSGAESGSSGNSIAIPLSGLRRKSASAAELDTPQMSSTPPSDDSHNGSGTLVNAASSSSALVSAAAAHSESEVRAAVRIQAYVRMKSARAEATQLQLVRTKRKNIGIEMLKTEETYVKTLDVLVNKIRVSMSTQSFRTAAGGVSEQDMKVIFPASLSMLLSAHESWLAQLHARIQAWSPQQCVGDLFLQLSPYLKMYIVYVSNFELSTLKIRELRRKPNSKFVELVHEVFVNLGDPTNDLASMLVTPVQRIPRYVMMLKDLLKHTSTQHPDYNNLLKAVKIMTDTTVLVDRKAEDAKNAQKVLEVADMIVDSPMPIVQPNRKWVKDGPVGLIVGPHEAKPRYAFLFTDVIVLCVAVEPPKDPKKKEDKVTAAAAAAAAAKTATQYRFQREMSLLAASVQSIKDDEANPSMHNLLVVRSPKLAFVLQAQSAADKAAWIKGIVSVIEMRKEGNQSRINAGASTTRSSNEARSAAAAAGAGATAPGLSKMLSESEIALSPKSSSADEDVEGMPRIKSDESESSVDRSK